MPAVATAFFAAPVDAETWHVIPAFGVEETLTNNVSLAPSNLAQSDLVTTLTPSLVFSGTGARASVSGSISVPILFYARTGAENNNVYPNGSVLGKVEAIEKFFYIEADASVINSFLTPFLAQPSNITSATENRYTTTTYRISPYVKGVAAGNVQYELRNNSYWSNLYGAPISTSNSYTSQWTGKLASPVAPLGWTADFDLTSVNFNNQEPQRTNLARVGTVYAYDPQLQLLATSGYEDNHYPLSDYHGFIYGAGVEWRPNERTQAVGKWEHRFFGSSYLFTFDHRTPLSAWSFNASRNITSYPQQLGTLTAGGNVQGLLDQLFLSRIPDPAQRQQFVDNFIQEHGLPPVLTSPVNLYTEQILLAENLNATMGLLGKRNSLFLTAFYLHNEPITGSGSTLPNVSAGGNNNTQTGANLTWTHNLTPLTTLNLTATALRTVANSPLTGTTRQGAVSLQASTLVSARTTLRFGARYQVLRSDVTTDYVEGAIFAGLTYTFH